MPRIQPIDYKTAPAETQTLHDQTVRDHGRVTNMKATLLHSPPAFHALMEWYTLRDVVQPFLGERLAHIFSHAISDQNDCLICSTFFRRLLTDAGDDPDNFTLNETEALVADFGKQLAQPTARVSDDTFARLSEAFTDEQIVALTAFGAMMVATNIINNALEVPFDDYLDPYKKGATSGRAPS
jgi:alkylhydroperoxidase family enzyme